ncbi:YceI family protein [Candidatus Kryptobacter tengchongensis]|uniref:Polyisoprenoid-binding protein YceI n=1 Tax=Kryptobacter tengchongensis TaxID=1643429 RepID=A0A656DA92_KRYT1|nr:YceI family protein [Candidatus Kryptobacter tengchongensis]CUT04737.1 Polyisoprenoid-binding protein YceI [Candidatus Kryptobacter tengchongensis]
MKFLLISVLVMFLFSTVFSQTVLIEAENGVSYVQYFLRHPLHSVRAINNEVKFLIEFDVGYNKIVKAEAVADVFKFNSGNSNRDSHAMEVIEALKYPTVTFKSNDIKLNGDNIIVNGSLTFHGQTREITMNGKVKQEGKSLIVEGSFQISLTDFKVKRPTLLFIPTDDTLKFYIYAKFNLPK